MQTETIPHPPIASPSEWLLERKELLKQEKELTRLYDHVNAQRRRMPMVRTHKQFAFDTPDGTKTLPDLFENRSQLIVYHFMFDPSWEQGCKGCTGFINALGDLSMLAERDTTFVVISRAPLEKLERYKKEKKWNIQWYSSEKSDFNYDYHATLNPGIVPAEYNYRNKAETEAAVGHPVKMEGEHHGISVFLRMGSEVFHTYSTYARGCESCTDAYRLLDLTPFGRQEDFEDSPPGWPQGPTYGTKDKS